MGLLTEEQVEQVWREQGLILHVERMHAYLVKNGLMPMTVQKHTFLDNFRKRVLTNFFVKGVVEDKHGRQIFPSDTD